MIDDKNKGFALLGRQLKTRCDALGKKRARFGVRPRPHCFARVMQKQRQVKNKRIVKSLKELPIRNQFRISRLRQRVEFVDANQCVLVRRVTVTKLVLHKAGQLAKLGNVASEEIHAMHHSKDASHFPLLR